MVSISTIAGKSGKGRVDLGLVFETLDTMAEPIAIDKKPLRIIAPAVMKIHNRTRDLEFELTNDKANPVSLATTAVNSFSSITDYYVIIAGIHPSEESGEKDAYTKELEFARAMVEQSYNILVNSGGGTGDSIDLLEIPSAQRQAYASSLKELRDRYPLPEFAKKEHMVRQRKACGCFSGCMIIIVYMIISGFIQILFATCSAMFDK